MKNVTAIAGKTYPTRQLTAAQLTALEPAIAIAIGNRSHATTPPRRDLEAMAEIALAALEMDGAKISVSDLANALTLDDAREILGLISALDAQARRHHQRCELPRAG